MTILALPEHRIVGHLTRDDGLPNDDVRSVTCDGDRLTLDCRDTLVRHDLRTGLTRWLGPGDGIEHHRTTDQVREPLRSLPILGGPCRLEVARGGKRYLAGERGLVIVDGPSPAVSLKEQERTVALGITGNALPVQARAHDPLAVLASAPSADALAWLLVSPYAREGRGREVSDGVLALVKHRPDVIVPLLALPGKGPKVEAADCAERVSVLLHQVGPAVLPAVLEALHHPDPPVRRTAALTCAVLRDPAVVPFLCRALEACGPEEMLLRALVAFEAREAVPSLLRLSRATEDEEGSAWVREALRAISPSAAEEADLEQARSKDEAARLAALARLGDEGPVDRVKVMAVLRRAQREGSADERVQATLALWSLGDWHDYRLVLGWLTAPGGKHTLPVLQAMRRTSAEGGVFLLELKALADDPTVPTLVRHLAGVLSRPLQRIG